jgi:hypothetical protein
MASVSVVRNLKANLINLIDNLPSDIKQKIYYDYFDVEVKYNRIMKIFRKQSGLTTLGSNILTRYLKKMLNDELLLSYVLKHSLSFKRIYTCYIKNDKTYYFEQIKDEHLNLTLQWIWCEYH